MQHVLPVMGSGNAAARITILFCLLFQKVNNICEETQLSIYDDGSHKNSNHQNISLAFTVEDIEAEYQKLLEMGVEIIEKPVQRPWGATNMSFYDLDRNIIYFRNFPV